MNRFLAALRFLTILPLPGGRGAAERDLAASLPFFPLVGLLLGGVAAAAAWGLALLAGPMLTAAALVVLLLAFSGGLHMDGLSDTADGFFSSRPPERVLEIMKDSRVGAMGVMAIASVLLLKFAALASAPPGTVWAAALLMPLAGRTAMLVHMAVSPYVRPGGLGAVFSARPGVLRISAVAGVVVAGGAGLLAARIPGLAAVGAAVAAALLLSAWSARKIGGATGDTYGAACEIGELAPAIVLALLLPSGR